MSKTLKKRELTRQEFEAIKRTAVIRSDAAGVYPPADLDDDVKFFVLALEELGAAPQYSCGGHPNGFYILFEAPYTLAIEIANCGFFCLELVGKNRWRLALNNQKTQQEKEDCLFLAAKSWRRILALETDWSICDCGAALCGPEDIFFWAECPKCRGKMPIQSRSFGDTAGAATDRRYHGGKFQAGEW